MANNQESVWQQNPWGELRELIGSEGGFIQWELQTLLPWTGAERAGARIVERLQEELARNRIGHLPAKLPPDRECRVLLYLKDHTAALNAILVLVQDLATQDVDEHTNAKVLGLEMLLKSKEAS
ncbi:hypothetical protein [Streptomyces sp. NPDC056056]|uniref:hypothetical protein n=1 Tax=Streptomyces sp. NPDC056056 TaxID=3345698 RepID=UPI0035DF9DED